jgi:hypothetical protein
VLSISVAIYNFRHVTRACFDSIESTIDGRPIEVLAATDGRSAAPVPPAGSGQDLTSGYFDEAAD